MTLRHLCLSFAAALGAVTLLSAGCATRDGEPRAQARAVEFPSPVVAAAGAVDAPDADRAIAALRAEGPAALERLLAAHDAATGAERARLAGWVDRVAAQRHATASRLYWYTDLDAAQAAARAAGKPILSLRMLGRLDEDRSCANSRFFRVALYANAALSTWLRDTFVLHWSSERPVPQITIDYGDGRRVESTVTGNSAHYVLDADGHVLDVIPGLVSPRAFRRELEAAVALAASLDRRARSARGLTDAERAQAIQAHHAAAQQAVYDEWQRLGAMPITDLDPTASLMAAQAATVTKAMVEVPMVKTARLGGSPQDVVLDVATWQQVGIQLLALRGLEATPRPAAAGAPVEVAVPRRRGEPAILPPPAVLDEASVALLTSLRPTDWARPGHAAEGDALDAVIRGFEAAIAGDTALNLLRLRASIHASFASWLTAERTPTFDQVNAWVYAGLFRTPADDAWLGLATPGVFTGLPGDGVVVTTSR